MASFRTPAQVAIGSAPWISNERSLAQEFISQETEDFNFSARNELEWLNEHMAEVFEENSMNFADMLKTPGRLRGKTPRTIRKGNTPGARAPLTDIFTTNHQDARSPLSPNEYNNNANRGSNIVQPREEVQHKTHIHIDKTDSGYHGMTDDDMQIDSENMGASKENVAPRQAVSAVSAARHADEGAMEVESSDRPGATESPKTRNVELESKSGSLMDDPRREAETVAATEDLDMEDIGHDLSRQSSPASASQASNVKSHSDGSSPVQPLIRKSSLNFASLPAREPLTTKKSIGASTSRASQINRAKSSGSTRTTHTSRPSSSSHQDGERDEPEGEDDTEQFEHVSSEELKATKLHHQTSTQRLQGKINMLAQSNAPRTQKSISNVKAVPNTEVSRSELAPDSRDREDQEKASDDREEWIPSETRAPTTQSRPQLAKSYTADIMQKIGESTLRTEDPRPPNDMHAGGENGDSGAHTSVVREAGALHHPKSASISILNSPYKAISAHGDRLATKASVSYPDLSTMGDEKSHADLTTPVGSPMTRKHADGPLSASKAKLSSLLKSAKGIFASSAGISAQAKMETVSPTLKRSQEELKGDNEADATPTRSLRSEKSALQPSQTAVKSPSPLPEGRKTRSSTEKAKQQDKQRDDPETAGDELPQITNEQKPSELRVAQEQPFSEDKPRAATEQVHLNKSGPKRMRPAETKGQQVPASLKEGARPEVQQDFSATRLERPQKGKDKEPKRPVKPSKENFTKAKPVPVSIRVDPVSQWGLENKKATQNTNQGQRESSQPQDARPQTQSLNRRPNLQKKPSNNSLHSSTTGTGSKFSTSTSSRPKALVVAERKREQEEREAQRKLDLQRENEKRRAAQQEEDRRQEAQHRREAERKRTEDRATAAAAEEQRRAVQRQNMEKRRQEMAQKIEQQQQQKPQTGNSRAKPVNNEEKSSQDKRPGPPAAAQRGELGNARPPSRMNVVSNARTVPEESSRMAKQPHINPAKPPKRPLQLEATEDSHRQPPKPAAPSQQNEHKRRKTDEDDDGDEDIKDRHAMPPPSATRASNMNNGQSRSIFSTGYTHATHNNAHHGPSLFHPATAPNQAQPARSANPMAMATYATGKIPFADNQGNAVRPSQPTRTPANKGIGQHNTRSSPRYPNGDAIELPEIATDSEDEDDENEFVVPDWARSPNLDPSLMGQQLWNPEEVFGPPNPTLAVEEIFTSKDRQPRFRPRSSSANWNGQDRLTQEEIQRDLEARQKLIANGGWAYGM